MKGTVQDRTRQIFRNAQAQLEYVGLALSDSKSPPYPRRKVLGPNTRKRRECANDTDTQSSVSKSS